MIKTITTVALGLTLATGLVNAEEKEVEIKCASGLQFDLKEIKIKAGTTLQINFSNPDIMQHNIVVVKPGKEVEVAGLALKMVSQADAMAKNYVPESDAIIASSKLLKKDEKEVLTVKLDTAGTYAYICTFPGHSAIMKGKIIVEAP